MQDGEMVLYRIRNKVSGLFLLTVPWGVFEGVWTPCGAFWKKPQTIRRHLWSLISEYERYEIRPNFCSFRKTASFQDRLINFEVVGTHVTVNKENTMQAKDFISVKEPA